MRYFNSNKNFTQYKPTESFFSKLKNSNKKREVKQSADNTAFNNPFLKEEPKSIKPKVTGFIFISIMVTWVYIILDTPYFQIKNIIINGNKITDQTEVKNFILNTDFFSKNEGFGNKNYFLTPVFGISQDVKKAFLYEDVTITKIFPDTINVNVIEKRAVVVYDNGENMKLLNIDGNEVKSIEKRKEPQQIVSLQATSSTELSDTTSISTTSKKISDYYNDQYTEIKNQFGFMPIIIGDIANKPTGKMIKNVLDWQKTLNTQSDLTIKYFITGDNEHNLKIIVNKPWYIIVDQTNDILSQLKNLKVIMANNEPKEYIDLRFKERVYWK